MSVTSVTDIFKNDGLFIFFWMMNLKAIWIILYFDVEAMRFCSEAHLLQLLETEQRSILCHVVSALSMVNIAGFEVKQNEVAFTKKKYFHNYLK